MGEELDAVHRPHQKAVGFDEIPPEVWRTRKFDDILIWLYNAVNKQT